MNAEDKIATQSSLREEEIFPVSEQVFNFSIPSWHAKKFEKIKDDYSALVVAFRNREIELIIREVQGPMAKWCGKPAFYDEIKIEYPNAVFKITHRYRGDRGEIKVVTKTIV